MSQDSAHEVLPSKEELDALGEEIATFAAKVDVATHALITRLRRFDAHEGWAEDEYATCAAWLSWRTGIGLNAAREKVRVARALGELKRVDALFEKGKLSFSKVRAITRVATPASEQDFIDIAMNATASQVERLCQAYRRTHEDKDASIPKPRRYVRRTKGFRGMTRIEMQLPREEAELVWEALMSAMDAGKRTPEASNLEGASAGPDAPAEAGDRAETSERGTHAERTTAGGRAAAADGTATPHEAIAGRGQADGTALPRQPTTVRTRADVTAVTREDVSAREDAAGADVTAVTREDVSARTDAAGADVTAVTRDDVSARDDAAGADVTAVTREDVSARDDAAGGSVPAAGGRRAPTNSSAWVDHPSNETARPCPESSERKRDLRDDIVSMDPHGHAKGCCAGAPMLPANDGEAQEEARADAMVDLARAYLKLRPRTLGSGYELVVITTPERLEAGVNEVGAVMRDGTPLPLEVARMLACDSARVNVTADHSGALLDVGRSTRTIPPSIARALWLRDGCCRVPGCNRRRHLQAHHIQHWADGGPTCLGNLVLVCSRHHKAIHEGRLFVEVRDGKIVFLDAQGRERPAAPPSAATGEELEALERFLRDADLHIDPSLNEPRWDGTRLDLDDALAWMSVADQTRTAAPTAPT